MILSFASCFGSTTKGDAMKHTKRDFRGWLQDGGTDANRLLGDILLGRIDEDCITANTQSEIEQACEILCDLIDKAREESLGREVEKAEREWEPADA
jgi:hypothetical protein